MSIKASTLNIAESLRAELVSANSTISSLTKTTEEQAAKLKQGQVEKVTLMQEAAVRIEEIGALKLELAQFQHASMKQQGSQPVKF